MTDLPARTMREYNAERRARQCSPACSEQHTYTPPCQLAPVPVAHATPSSGEEAEAGFDAIMRLYPRRTLWGRKRWWYDCSRCGTTSGPFADQAATIGDVGQHVAEWHESAPDDTDLTEADIDRMMADGTPVQIVNGPPPTFGTPAPASAPEPGLRERLAGRRGDYAAALAQSFPGPDSTRLDRMTDALIAVADQEHTALKRAHVALAEQAGKDQAAIARVHAVLISLCREPHPSHGHLCPDDVRRTILDALDQPQEQP